MCTWFQVNNSFLSKKLGGNFNSSSSQRFPRQNMSVGIGIIELTELSDTFNYEAYFKQCFLHTSLHFLYCLYLFGTKFFVQKTEPYFTFV